MEIIRPGGTQRQKGRGKNTALLFQEASKPRQFCSRKTFEKDVCMRTGICVFTATQRPPQPGLRSVRSMVPPPSAHAESNLLHSGNPLQSPPVGDSMGRRTLSPREDCGAIQKHLWLEGQQPSVGQQQV